MCAHHVNAECTAFFPLALSSVTWHTPSLHRSPFPLPAHRPTHVFESGRSQCFGRGRAHTPGKQVDIHTRTGLRSRPHHHRCLTPYSPLNRSPPRAFTTPSAPSAVLALFLLCSPSNTGTHGRPPFLNRTAMAAATSSFEEFAREWGGLLAQDSSASLEHLFSAYVGFQETNHVVVGNSGGSGKSPFDSPVASIEDFTDVWAAAKRANREWEATCMVRSVRHSIDGSVTRSGLVLSMLCWAAALRQREQSFFKEFFSQVREIIRHAALRCAACADAKGAESIYEEVAFCVALELLGWHDSLLICLQRSMAFSPPLRSEEDVLLFLRKVTQELASGLSPRGCSTDSTPAITTTSTSALSSSFEHEPPATSTTDNATKKMTALTFARATGDGAVVFTSSRRPFSTQSAASASRRRVEQTRAVRRRGTTISTVAPSPFPSNTADTPKLRQATIAKVTVGATAVPAPTKARTVSTARTAAVSSASPPLPPSSLSSQPCPPARTPLTRLPTSGSLAPMPVPTHHLPTAIAAHSACKRLKCATPDVCRPPVRPAIRPSAHQQDPPHKKGGNHSTATSSSDHTAS
ncbi:hypothetical protein LSCM4_07850 [Leishmania orientalis]|uniref:Uncharacterized protein n=1 Tax=Leishmania orientalis TaxID=2249476 RepID=A0A836H3V0_9TRYP|nr:hypothetical protein LSCM4_07850 [Leishmania orientalis]